MEKLAELLKVFIEKHLVSTVSAIGLAILFVALTPSDFIVIEKLGLLWHGIFLFCICFIAIKIIIVIYNFLHKKIYEMKNSNARTYQINKENELAVEKLWAYVDNLSPIDKEHLLTFIQTDNAPIEGSGIFMGDSLFNSKFVNATIVKAPEEERIPITQLTKGDSMGVRVPIEKILFSQPITQYKLKEDFYRVLKYSYKNYSKISHFD